MNESLPLDLTIDYRVFFFTEVLKLTIRKVSIEAHCLEER